tara:strand:+ start:5689 stop:6867 length:1179 start_codon:yes stop_codon:yes gene_type:complete
MFPDFEVKEFSKVSENRGTLKFQDVEDKLMHSVIEHDEKEVDKGKMMAAAINQGFSSFHPDLMMEHLAKDYSMARQVYGEGLLRLVSGYDPSTIQRNIRIPEFQRELQDNIKKNFDDLVKDKLVDRAGNLQNKAYELASLIMYTEELDHMIPKGMLGKKVHKKKSHYGDKEETRIFKKGDRYRDLALKKSIRSAIKRGHSSLHDSDLQVFERQSKGGIYVVYGMDASGSMKGKKIEMAKKAGIALAFNAIQQKDNVGLLVFRSDVKDEIYPGQDFGRILKTITKVTATQETNLVKMIRRSMQLFPKDHVTKHLLILSDALPTIGKDPEKETLQAVSEARANGITISLVGINLDKSGKALAEKIVQHGDGRLFMVRNIENMDTMVLEDYYSLL